MDFQYLFTKTEGRISRKTWWIGVLILAVANIVVSLLVLPLVGLGGPNLAALTAGTPDLAVVAAQASGAIRASAWAGLVVFLIFAYPSYCLSLKRRQDKNNNGRDLLIYLVLTAAVLLIQALGFGYTDVEVQPGITLPMPNMLFSTLTAVIGILGIYMLVVLGFLKGTEGPNDFGPDPLMGGSAATA